MIYKGQFYTVDNNKLYTVRITDKTGNQTTNMTLGGSPFVTQMDSDSKNIFKPVKCQSATVTVIAESLYIYASKAQDVKVELLDENNTVAWVGYVQPNVYNQGFVEEREEIEIECIDALSSLQYIKYSTQKKQVISFLGLIKKLLNKCNAYNQLYISDNIQLKASEDAAILEKLYISEQCFFD